MGQQAIQEVLRTMLANVAAVRQFFAVASVDAAKLRIHHDALPDPESDVYSEAEREQLFPSMMIYSDKYTTTNVATPLCWSSRGLLGLRIFRPTPDDQSASQVNVTFRTEVDSILDGLIALSDTAGYLPLRSMDVEGPFRTPPNEVRIKGDYMMFEVMISWGVDVQG